MTNHFPAEIGAVPLNDYDRHGNDPVRKDDFEAAMRRDYLSKTAQEKPAKTLFQPEDVSRDPF